jgi:hypothetical protein
MDINNLSASANISMDDFVSIKKEDREEYFYNLCSTENSSLQIKKLFLLLKTKQLFDNDLLYAGLLSAIENKQEPYIDLMINFIEKNNIKFNQYQYNPLFNCSFYNKNDLLVSYFDSKCNVINQNLSREVFLEMHEDGTIPVAAFAADSNIDLFYMVSSNYLRNTEKFRVEPLKFAVTSLNEEMLNFILEKSQNNINPLLIDEIVIDSCLSDKIEQSLFLLNHKVIGNIIKKSKNINLFLNEPTQLYEIKKEVRAALLMLELNNSLENKNNKTNKPKL